MLRAFAAAGGLVLLAITLADAIDTIVVARRAERIFRITAWFYELTWNSFSFWVRRVESTNRRERLLSVYGPLSLLVLLALWAVAVILSFALLHRAANLRVAGGGHGLALDFITSAGALFTMQIVHPLNGLSNALMVVEAGLGFSLLGLVVGYLPVLYQSFSSREEHISLLDARAGSPSAASELIIRQGRNPSKLESQLAAWETWASQVLETHLAYPMLAYFRSQHENQSWLGALITILDASAITLMCGEGDLRRQAELTFAMGRHTLADMVTVFRLRPPSDAGDRLPTQEFERLRSTLSRASTALAMERLSVPELARLRALYEPFAVALSHRFLMALPKVAALSEQRLHARGGHRLRDGNYLHWRLR